MSSQKLITVYGATGNQGGSVLSSLLQNKSGNFKLRAITRNTGSERSKALAAQGVEVVQALGLEKQQILDAFKGSWGAFVNTNSDDKTLGQPGGPTEIDLGKIIIDAAFEAGVQHFVYSGSASASKVTKGVVPNKAFDEKNAVGEYAKTKGFKSVTIIGAGWYMENHLVEEIATQFGGFPFVPDEEGYLTLRCPRWGGNDEVPFVTIGEDFGDFVHGIFLNPEAYNGHLIQAISHGATTTQLVKAFEKVTGKKTRFIAVEDWKSIETYGESAMETVKSMFGFCQESGGLYYGVPNNPKPAAELKSAAAKAQGKGEGDASPTSLERFFAKYFSQ